MTAPTATEIQAAYDAGPSDAPGWPAIHSAAVAALAAAIAGAVAEGADASAVAERAVFQAEANGLIAGAFDCVLLASETADGNEHEVTIAADDLAEHYSA